MKSNRLGPLFFHRSTRQTLLVVLLGICVLSGLVVVGTKAAHASFSYYIPKQQDQITINEDGNCQLVRYFEFYVNASSSDSGTEIWAGLPTSRTRVVSVTDQNGKDVPFRVRSNQGEYVVVLTGFGAIKPGSSKGFTITATIPDFLFPDSRNQGYVTMQYSPGYWSEQVKLQDIAVILPGKVEKSEIKTGSRLWDGIAQTKSGAYVVTWQFRDIKPNQKVSINIGFPEKYVKLAPVPEPQPSQPLPPGVRPPSVPGFDGLGTGVLVFFFVALFGLIAAIASVASRQHYSSPQLSMEGVGVNENLSPIEASVLLRLSPERTLTLLLFSLLKKGVLRAYSGEPLRLSIEYEEDLSETEKLFVSAIDRTKGELDPKKLAPCYKYLVTSVNEKMKPYCRKDTEAFYREKVRDLWAQIEAEESPEVKLSSMDKEILWLLQDEEKSKAATDQLKEEYESKNQGETPSRRPDGAPDAFPDYEGPFFWLRGLVLGRAMFGYPYSYYGYAGYPFWAFYPNVYMGFDGLSGEILGGQEGYFREIRESVFVPAPTRVLGGGPRGGHGGFTPPSCACACACVSCACACACAGGGGCT